MMARHQLPPFQAPSILGKRVPWALSGMTDGTPHWRVAPANNSLTNDSDAGLERLRQNSFAHGPWMLKRWAMARTSRAFSNTHLEAFLQPMRPM